MERNQTLSEMKVGTAADLTINDLTVNEITLTNELPLDMGGTHTDTSAFAADSINDNGRLSRCD